MIGVGIIMIIVELFDLFGRHKNMPLAIAGGGALALYSQNRDGSRGALLATCACGGRLLAWARDLRACTADAHRVSQRLRQHSRCSI